MNEPGAGDHKPSHPLLRRMRSRDPRQAHRAATPLELLYDLCFVVAIAQAAARLHHGIAENHTPASLLGFGLVFFAIWWAWMGFTWFASAFDADDVIYRIKVLVQMAGVLVLAAGVPRAFDQQDFGLITLGYVIMRVGLVAQWLRAARADALYRKTALRYAVGITLVQACWIALLALPADRWVYGWLVFAPLELLVPAWAESARATPWHPHHIAERYGLFTIIVLGESVLAATLAIQAAVDAGSWTRDLACITVAAPVILFGMWWIYFLEPAQRLIDSSRKAFVWGYSHFFVFASAAAVGAGIAVCVDQATHHAHVPEVGARAALAIPVAIYLLSVWFTQYRTRAGCGGWSFVAVSILILATPLAPFTPVAVAVLIIALTAYVIHASR